MTNTTLALAALAVTLLALNGYLIRYRHSWADRDITPLGGYRVIVPIQNVTAVASYWFIAATWGSAAGIAAAAFAWLGVFSVATDLKTRLIPWDAFYPVSLVGLIAFGFGYGPGSLLSFGIAGLAWGTVWIARFLTNQGLGMSDIRLLGTAVVTTTWWAGPQWFIYALILACGIQLVARIAAGVTGWGRMVPAPTRNTTEATSDPTGTSGSVAPDGPVTTAPRLRRELPFAPALVVALFAMTAYGTVIGYGACATWSATGSC